MITRSGEIASVREHLISPDPPALLGGRCGSCTMLSFPAESYCPFCGAKAPEVVALATQGTIYSFCIARFPPPGYNGDVPFGIGLVDLPDGIRVASTLLADPIERLTIGAAVHFEPLELATDEGPVLSYAYVLEDA